MVNRIYIDTSVIGGYFDDVFEEATVNFFEQAVKRKTTLIISNITEAELNKAPKGVRTLLEELPIKKIEKVFSTRETDELAQKYIHERVVGKTSFVDCQHIAIATINVVDVLVSWNFKHIVNIERIRGYNSVNLRLGYHVLEIRNPNEIFSNEK